VLYVEVIDFATLCKKIVPYEGYIGKENNSDCRVLPHINLKQHGRTNNKRRSQFI
jgi:hypothetical protein